MGQPGHFGDIDDLQGGIGRRFDKDAGRGFGQGLAPLVEIGAIDQFDLDAEPGAAIR